MVEGEPRRLSPEEEAYQTLLDRMRNEQDPVIKQALAEFLIAVSATMGEEEIPDVIAQGIKGGQPPQESDEKTLVRDFYALQKKMQEEKDPVIKMALAKRLIAVGGLFEKDEVDADDPIGLGIQQAEAELYQQIRDKRITRVVAFLAVLGASLGERAKETSVEVSKTSLAAIAAGLLIGHIYLRDWMKKQGWKYVYGAHLPKF